MIQRRDIYQSLAKLIKGAGLEMPVYNNHNLNATEDYIWIRLHVVRYNEGFGMFSRKIRVDIVVSLVPDDKALVDVDKLNDIAERLELAVGDYLTIYEHDAEYQPLPNTERFITIYDIDTTIIEETLLFSFYLDFSDYCAELDSDRAVTDFMEHLELELDTGS